MTLASQKEILNIKKQLSIFDVSETNFFETNSFAIDLADKIQEELMPLCDQFDEIVYNALNQFDSVESTMTSFCLENLESGKQINELYDSINKGTFIEFQNTAYQTLFNEILEIDEIDLINKVKNFLAKSNEELILQFENRKDDFKNLLQNKIFGEFYTKSGLEQKINSIYSEGLYDLDVNSKNSILNYINEIISKIETHIKNEKYRISNELTSYSKNFDVIKKTLNDYKIKIYEEFYSTIFSVINDFYSIINEKFYENYVKKNLDIYYNYTKNEKFSNHSFLNISFNLKEIIDEDIEILTSEYKNWTLNQINFLNESKTEKLSELFLIKNLKTEIGNKIDKIYNTNLLPILKEKAIYNSGEEGISDYDFSENILNDINSLINEKIAETRNLIEKMKGPKYNIESDWKKPDFSEVKRYIFSNITNQFNSFIANYAEKEIQDFNLEISENLKDNFKDIINNFVPSFGKDYFERVLKYNEIQKIKSLYNNLKDSTGVTLTYYIYLTSSGSMDIIPNDLEIKILSLNDLDTVVSSKNNEVISILTSKFNNFIESTKNDLVNKYITYMKNDKTIKQSFKDNILELLNDILINQENSFKNEYQTAMNTYIKDPFIEDYIKTIKEETKDMIDFIEENKEVLKEELRDTLGIDKDETLTNIENKLNDTLNAIKDYKSHFETFKISENIKNFLNDYVQTYLLSKHKEIKNILDEKTKNLVLDYLNINSENFKNAFSEAFELKLNATNDLLKNSYIDLMIEYLKQYGTIETIYSTNLNNEIIKFSNENKRRLESNEEINPQFSAPKLEESFQILKESSKSVTQFIETSDIFANFDDKINKYINNIKDQYESSKKSIKERRYTEEISNKLYKGLEDLKEFSLLYYENAKKQYDQLKQYIINSIKKIDNFVQKSNDVTYKIINAKYQDYKNDFISINNKINEERDIEDKSYDLTIQSTNENYNTQIKMNKITVDNEFYYDIIIEGEEEKLKKAKLIGKSKSCDKPSSLVVDFSKKLAGSKCINKGKELTVNLNDFSLNINLDGDLSSAYSNINKIFHLDEYTIDNKYYNQTQQTKTVIIKGIKTTKIICSGKNILSIPQGEKAKDIIEGINENITNNYEF